MVIYNDLDNYFPLMSNTDKKGDFFIFQEVSNAGIAAFGRINRK